MGDDRTLSERLRDMATTARRRPLHVSSDMAELADHAADTLDAQMSVIRQGRELLGCKRGEKFTEKIRAQAAENEALKQDEGEHLNLLQDENAEMRLEIERLKALLKRARSRLHDAGWLGHEIDDVLETRGEES